MAVNDEQIQRYFDATDKLAADVSRIEHDLIRMDEKRQADRDLLVSIKEGQDAMMKAWKDSVSAVHRRVDDLQDAQTEKRGIEKGRAEQRAVMFKWIAGVVGLIAIVGYIGRGEAAVLPPHNEKVIYESRRFNG